MSKFLRAVLGSVAGYAVGAAAGALLITLFSGNMHDKALKMTMTAAFVTGPSGAIVGLVAGLVRT